MNAPSKCMRHKFSGGSKIVRFNLQVSQSMRDKEHRSTSATIYSSKFNLIDQSILYRELEYRYVSPTRGNSLNWDIFSIHVALTSVATFEKNMERYTHEEYEIYSVERSFANEDTQKMTIESSRRVDIVDVNLASWESFFRVLILDAIGVNEQRMRRHANEEAQSEKKKACEVEVVGA